MKRVANGLVLSLMALVFMASSASAQTTPAFTVSDNPADPYVWFTLDWGGLNGADAQFSVTTNPLKELWTVDTDYNIVTKGIVQPTTFDVPAGYPLYILVKRTDVLPSITITATGPDGTIYTVTYPEASGGPIATSITFNVPTPPVQGTSFSIVTTVAPVPPGTGTPTGYVSLVEGTTTLGPVQLISGVATFTTETTAGDHVFTAQYVGQDGFASSQANITVTVAKAAATVAVTSSLNPAIYGQAVTFTAGVTSLASGTPTGSVTFNEGVTLLGTGTVTSGVATISTSSLSAIGSPHAITATYSGDANFAGSTSTPLTQVVTPKALTVAGIAANDKVYDGTTAATINATGATLEGIVGTDAVTLNPAGASGTFGDKNVGSAKTVVVSGLALSGTLAGNYTVTEPSTTASISVAPAVVTALPATKVYGTSDPAAFTGNLSGFFAVDGVTASFARTAGETVAGSPYTISGTVSPAAALTNYAITYNTAAFTITKAAASVTPATASKVYGTPDPVPLTTGTLTGFLASDNVTAAYSRTAGEPVGTYTISATLSPAGVLGNYDITHNAALFTITPNASSTAIASSINPSVLGQAVTLTATVTSLGGTPTGSVTFKDGVTSLGTGALNGTGVATLSTSALTAGTHSITAVYGGDPNFAGSTSDPLLQIVNAPRYTLTVNGTHGSVTKTPDQPDYASGETVQLTATPEQCYYFTGWSGGVTGSTNPLSVTMDANKTITANFVANSAPVVDVISAPLTPVEANTVVNASVSFTDPNTNDTHTASWSWGDGATSAGVISDQNVVTGSHTYATAGVYTLGVTVSDACGAQAAKTFEFVVVYDPTAGFVTGGGHISSPEGAYVTDPSLTGKANVGFVAKYKKGADIPTGETEFQLKPGLKFKSKSYEWLTISGALAVAKGVGTVNGSGNFGFIVSAIDGKITGEKIDKFRMKIWNIANGNAVVYDSQMGAEDNAVPTTVVQGGSIAVHLSKDDDKTSASGSAVTTQEESLGESMNVLPTAYALYNAYPNPFNPSTTIGFDLPDPVSVRLVVYDMLGREVAVLVNEAKAAGHYSVVFNSSNLSSGIYVYRFQAGNFVQTKKLMLMK